MDTDPAEDDTPSAKHHDRDDKPDWVALATFLKAMRARTRVELREVWNEEAGRPEMRCYPVRVEDASSAATQMTIHAACCFFRIGLYFWANGAPRTVLRTLQGIEAGTQRLIPSFLCRVRRVYCMSDMEMAELVRLYEQALPQTPYILAEDTLRRGGRPPVQAREEEDEP